MNYRETLETLYNMMPDFQQVGAGAYKPGLERVDEFLNMLGRPQERFRSVHVAGTNGKGSVSHMTAAVLQGAGRKTGLYTSPHLRDFRERIRIDGETIPEEAVIDFAERHLATMRALKMSFFEATMCMAFDWFARSGVDIAVVEAGLGGRLDSTNILTPLVSVITNIGLEHQQFLGNTLAEIAAEKAGIIKRGVPVVVGEHGEADEVFIRTATNAGAPLVFAQDIYKCIAAHKEGCRQTFTIEDIRQADFAPSKVCRTPPPPSGGRQAPTADGVTPSAILKNSFDITVDLLGDYQTKNIVTLLAVVDVLEAAIIDRALGEVGRTPPAPSGVRLIRDAHSSPLLGDVLPLLQNSLPAAAVTTGLRGRWEVLGHHPLIVADTAHNAHGIALVAEQIRNEHYEKLYIIIGVAADKDLGAILPLLPRDAHYIFTAPRVSRAMPAADLAARAADYSLHGEIAPTVPDALARARTLASPHDMIFIGGSNFTVAEILI
jgi:dihydrofolate synthase/folylpolyglutamate synthase